MLPSNFQDQEIKGPDQDYDDLVFQKYYLEYFRVKYTPLTNLFYTGKFNIVVKGVFSESVGGLNTLETFGILVKGPSQLQLN